MGHLTRETLLALVEGGVVDAGSVRHAAECDRCGREVAALADVLRSVRSVGVPEPSPLFWDLMSARIRERVGAEERPGAPLPPAGTWPSLRWWVPAAALSAAVVALSAVTWTTPAPDAGQALALLAPDDAVSMIVGDAEESAGPGDTVLEVAAQADWGDPDEVAAIGVAVAGDVGLGLDPDEQLELERSLRAELGSPSF